METSSLYFTLIMPIYHNNCQARANYYYRFDITVVLAVRNRQYRQNSRCNHLQNTHARAHSLTHMPFFARCRRVQSERSKRTRTDPPSIVMIYRLVILSFRLCIFAYDAGDASDGEAIDRLLCVLQRLLRCSIFVPAIIFCRGF